MADDPIPGDLREFILGHIDSIAQLEALLLLRRNPSTTWNPSCVAERLYVTEGEATDLLTRLNDDGFLIV
jgi:DNA-binding MarR family transcriptional regulator